MTTDSTEMGETREERQRVVKADIIAAARKLVQQWGICGPLCECSKCFNKRGKLRDLLLKLERV